MAVLKVWMRSFFLYATFFGASVLLLSGCGVTEQVGMSSALSSDIQLRLQTVEEFETDFEFTGHPQGDELKITTPGATAIYDLNGTLEGRLTQLVRSKFGSINRSSGNRISVSIDGIDTENDTKTFANAGSHNVSVRMNVEILREGETFTRTIQRSAQIDADQTGSSFAAEIEVDKAQLEEFVMQFVVGVDSFIDSNFGVD